MNIAPPDQIIESGNAASPGNFFDTGYRFKNRDGTAYITVGAGGFTVTGTFTASGYATGFTAQASTDLAKGDAVYISSCTATGVPIVTPADADASGKAAVFVVTDATILSGAQGTVALTGLSAATLNTNAATVGDPVYLSTTGTTTNTWTLTAPTGAGARVQKIGQVNVKSATVGQIAYNLTGATTQSFGTNELQAQSVTMPKLARGTNGQIIVANTGADPAYVSMSGDATLSAAGALTIGAAITPAKVTAVTGTPIAPGAIAAGSGAVPYQIVLACTNIATGDLTWTGFPFKFFVTGVTVIKTGAAGACTYIVKNGSPGTAITNAMATVNDTDTVYCNVIDDAQNSIAAAASVTVSIVRTSGDSRAMIVLNGFIQS